MATYSKVVLSGSTNGKGIKLAAVATPGDLIHNVGAGEANADEIWLWAVNSSTGAKKVTIEFGTHDAPDGNIEVSISPESGLYLIVPGLLLNNDLDINAFCETTNVVMIYGFVNRITA